MYADNCTVLRKKKIGNQNKPGKLQLVDLQYKHTNSKDCSKVKPPSEVDVWETRDIYYVTII